MADDTKTWALIHAERAAMADTLATLTADQWAQRSLCGTWSVREAAGHIVGGAEQTPANFITGMASTGFRFNTLMDRTARRLGKLEPDEIVARIRSRVTTTNHPPAPVVAMLGEIVVHGEDIRRPLGIGQEVSPDAQLACLQMYQGATFPVGGKKRMAGLRLKATDVDWTHGDGPEVLGTGMALMLAMTGRPVGADQLSGDGAATMLARIGR
jgi:uncharacterized protein (TIGR03083 family)